MSTSALGYGALNRDAVNSSVSARYSNNSDHRCSPRVDDSAAAGYRYSRSEVVTSSSATAVRRCNRDAPRELDDDEFAAAFMAPPGDDEDHFLFVSVPTSVTVVDDVEDFIGSGDNGNSCERNRQLLRIIAAGSRTQPVVQNGGTSGRRVNGQNVGGSAATASSSNCIRGSNGSAYQQVCRAEFSSGFQPVTRRAAAPLAGYLDNRPQPQQPRVDAEPPDRRRLELDEDFSRRNSRPLDYADRHQAADEVDFNNFPRRRPATVDAATAAAAAAGRVSVDVVTDDRMPTSPDGVLLSPRSPGVLSPSGRRSGLPIPTWTNPRPNSRMESQAPLSPVSVPSGQQWPSHSSITMDRQRPQSSRTPVRDDVTSGRRADDAGGPFRRNVPGRASMFEHGSRRREAPQQQRQLHNGGGTLLSARRSEYGAPSYNKQRSSSPPAASTFNGYLQSTVSSRAAGQRQDQNQSFSRQTSQNGDSLRYATSDSVRRNGTTDTMSAQPRNTEARDQQLSSRETFAATEKPKLASRTASVTSRDTYCSFPSNMFKDIVDESSSVHSGSNIWDCRVTIMDVSDILTNLQSSEWSSRRDGLASLENMFRTGACLTPPDLKRVTEIFTRMFHDPHGKVFSVFVEVLVDFVTSHSADLGHWLPIVLPRLFLKLGTSDMRPSLLVKIQKALEAARESFASDLQMEVLARFMTDQAQTCGPKVKEAVLDYLHELVLDMDTQDLVNGSTLQTLLLRVVMWSADPQSAEVRNLAHAVVAAMFNVNSPEFVLAMTSQPKGVQDMVSRVLKAHMYNSSPDDSHRHQPGQQHHRRNTENVHFTNGVRGDVTVVVGQDHNNNQRSTVRKTISAPPAPSPGKTHRNPVTKTSSSIAQPSGDTAGRHARESRTTGQVTSGRTSLLPRHSQTEETAPVVKGGKPSTNRRRNCLSIDSGVTTGDSSPETKNSPTFDNIPENEPNQFEVFDTRTVLGYCSSNVPAELNIDGNPSDRRRQWVEIVQILSDGTARSENRKLAMRELIDSLPADCARISQSTVKCLLVVLLSATEGDDEVSVLARECGAMLLDSAVVPSKCCRLLTEVVELGLFPVNLAALQLLKVRLDVVGDVTLPETLGVLTAGLIKAYEDDESRVRKASIDVLVKLYENVGELIWTHIHGLADYKISFLRTKFRRAALLRLSVADAV